MKDYFVYLPETAAAAAWEGSAVSAGFTRVPPHSPYPPYRHPTDHHFTWSDGRVLSTYTLVYIVAGGGVFELDRTLPPQKITAGTVFVVFPGVWHRYAPAPETGWTEHWLEVRGPAFDRLQKTIGPVPAQPVVRAGLDPDLVECFDRCHAWAQHRAAGSQAVLCTLALHLFALLEQIERRNRPAQAPIDEAIHRAQVWMAENCHRKVDMREVARAVGAGYSHFRQAFREHAGISPKQYHLRLRLRRAEELLLNTSQSLKEIALLLGFDSLYHFSTAFKLHTGLAPSRWRLRHLPKSTR